MLPKPLPQDTANDSGLDGYIRSLDYDPRQLLAVHQDDSAESMPAIRTRSEEGNSVIVTTKKRHSLRKNLSDLAILRPTSGVIFPGALVIADRNLTEGLPLPIGLSRRPVALSIDLPGLRNSRLEVAAPSNSTVSDAVAGLLEAWIETTAPHGYVNAARSFLEIQSVFSSEQVALQLGFSAKWASGSASAQLNASTNAETSSVLARFKQVFYTVTMDTPRHPAEVFGADVTVDDLRQVVDASHPAAYVRSVDYGRVLMIRMDTTAKGTRSDLQSALQSALQPIHGGAEATAKYEAIARSSTFTVVALGGGAQTAATFTGSPDDMKLLRDYIQKDATFRRDNPGAPVSYTVALLKDNQVATMGFTTEYTETESIEYPNAYVQLRHSGAYVAKFTVSWEQGDAQGAYLAQRWESGNKTAGYTHQVDLPGDARNIKIVGEAATGLVWDPWGEAINVTLVRPDRKCYRIKGTTLDRSWDNEC